MQGKCLFLDISRPVILRIQEILSDMKQNEDDLNTPIYRVQLSFVPSEQIQDYLSSSYTMGSVKLDKSKSEITVPEILFPVSSIQQSLTNTANRLSATAGTSQSARQSVALTQMKGRKLGRYNVKLTDDMDACDITGMEITSDGRRLLEDGRNKKVKLFSRDRKLFSRDMRLLSYLLFSMHPHDIAVLSDQEAVVTTANKSLALLNISGRHMSINTTTSLAYDVYSISQYGEKLVVTSYSPKPASVKLIDMTGRVYWSVSSDAQGKSLFDSPQYVTSDVERRIVTVTDWKNNTLTVLNGETGAVIKRLSLKDKYPEGVTTGPSGNIYVCYAKAREVAVLTGGLAVERILLSQRDCLGIGPRAIVYDKIRGQLITSYSRFISDHNSVDIWELS